MAQAPTENNARSRLARPLAWQGAYYVTGGLAPFVSRRAFEALTGPKREWWLVQTVGALTTAVGAGMLAGAARRKDPSAELVVIAGGCAVALAAVDVVHVARRRISPVYLLDAAANLAAIVALATAARGGARRPR